MPLVRVLGYFFRSLVGRAGDRQGRFRRARSLPRLPLIFLAGIVMSIPLAYASPPDPTWIEGIYDAADYDDAVGLVVDGTGASPDQAPARVDESPGAFVLLLEPGEVPHRVLWSQMSRGPPPTEAGTRLGSALPYRNLSSHPVRPAVFFAAVHVAPRACLSPLRSQAVSNKFSGVEGAKREGRLPHVVRIATPPFPPGTTAVENSCSAARRIERYSLDIYSRCGAWSPTNGSPGESGEGNDRSSDVA
jgi:hypothetical protein